MSDTEALDKAFHFIMKQMVATGQAPHYTEIAAELGVEPEEGRKTMHTLFESGIHGWLYPKTGLKRRMPRFWELTGENFLSIPVLPVVRYF